MAMRRWLLLLATIIATPLGAAMAPPLPPAAPERMVLAQDTEAQWVPFELTPGNQIKFSMAIDGRPITAILDTGVTVSVLSHRFATDNGLKVMPGSQAIGVGGSVALGWANGRALTIGGLTRSGGRMGVVDLPTNATGGAEPVDALIGRDLVDRYALDIDFAQRRFRLLPSGRLPFVGESAPLTIAPRQQLYVSELKIGSTNLRPVIIDTGDGATVTMSTEAWRSLPLTRPQSTTTLSYSVGGPVTTELMVLPSVSVGGATLQDAEARIEPAGGFSAKMGVAGRIGLGFLQHYRVLLDPRAGRMVLASTGDAPTPLLRSTSGLLFSIDHDRLQVLHVMRGGPAAAGGWKAGDQICSIDGTPVGSTYATNPIARWSIDSPGRMVALGMCNGSMRDLTLEHFY
jgi:predicted aspartyl protease